jgi:hypothetical protein
LEPVLANGLTRSQTKLVDIMLDSRMPPGQVAAHIEQMRQASTSNRQQAAIHAAMQANEDYNRRRQYEQDVRAYYDRQRQAEEDPRARTAR